MFVFFIDRDEGSSLFLQFDCCRLWAELLVVLLLKVMLLQDLIDVCFSFDDARAQIFIRSGLCVNSLRTCRCEGVKFLKLLIHGKERRSSVIILSKLSKVNSKFDGACGGCHLEGI